MVQRWAAPETRVATQHTVGLELAVHSARRAVEQAAPVSPVKGTRSLLVEGGRFRLRGHGLAVEGLVGQPSAEAVELP